MAENVFEEETGRIAEFCRRVAIALEDGYGLPADAVTWFTLHAELDEEHAGELPRYVGRVLERHAADRLRKMVLQMHSRHRGG